jgi:hypothetical protein
MSGWQPVHVLLLIGLLIALSVLVQLGVAKFLYQKRKARERLEAAQAQRPGKPPPQDPP